MESDWFFPFCGLTYTWNLKDQTHRNRDQIGGWGLGLSEGVVKKFKLLSYTINKVWECNAHPNDYSQYCIDYPKFLKE